MNLREIFKDDVSSSAFKVIDGETRIVGKHGQLSVIGNYFDVWFVGKDLEPLSSRRLTNLANNPIAKEGLVRLDGESFYQTKDESRVRLTLPLLGVKKRRKLSQEQIETLSQRMKDMRRVKCSLIASKEV